jgi:hypothetical protein
MLVKEFLRAAIVARRGPFFDSIDPTRTASAAMALLGAIGFLIPSLSDKEKSELARWLGVPLMSAGTRSRCSGSSSGRRGGRTCEGRRIPHLVSDRRHAEDCHPLLVQVAILAPAV